LKRKKLARAERNRIAATYGVVVPTGLRVAVLPAGATGEDDLDRSWAAGSERRGRMAARARRFEAAARKYGDDGAEEHQT
jgi:hypothetical protein